ncbi:MAG: purine-nucleoside phosphorylase [Clostridia bacterium]|nr:purine-nucleoside phosphorylase [Clostridia bacterium]
MTAHNEAKKGDIAKVVIMPGDPLRAKYIAENFLTDYKLVNSVRNMFAYTGFYKEKKITVMASGMGMPSMGIYCYELYKFYDVETIIRVGSCGVYVDSVNLLDTILVKGSFTTGNFAKNLTGDDVNFVESSAEIDELIEKVAQEMNISIRKGNVACTECFDPYLEDVSLYLEQLPEERNLIGAEMEAFALFYTAKVLNKKAACLLTVVDSIKKKQSLTSEDRQNSLNEMIKISLETAIKLT